jgi:hypothetical protein
MSIHDANTRYRQAGGYSSHLPDLFYIRQLERLLKHTSGGLELVKARVTQLENDIAILNSVAAGKGKTANTQRLENTSQALSIPIAEMRQLAEMAKRFR